MQTKSICDEQGTQFWNTVQRYDRETVYVIYTPDIVMGACETWFTTRRDKEKLITFERKVSWKIHGPVRNQNGEYERRNNVNNVI